MTSLYSVIPGLTPSSQEILEAELLVKQTLEGKFPDLDLREGTGLRDLVLQPTAYAFALLKKANDYYFAQNTLQGVDNTTSTEIVDDILSNWFLYRNLGTYAVISARLFFARQKNVTLTTDISFSPDNSLVFYPQEAKVYSSDAMTYDPYANEWYIDVFLKAADTGASYNIGEGSLIYFTNFDPYFLRAEINYLADESSNAETNTEFVSRASTAISTRNLINVPSVDSRLREVFNYLSHIVTVGGGSSDMIRDFIKSTPPKPVQYTPTAVDIIGSTVTFSVSTDLLLPGQQVLLSGAVPEVFNGTFTITDTGSGEFSVEIPGNVGYISQLPTITRVSSSLYLHIGGKVDVYCGTRLAVEVVTDTIDANGKVSITGPVYNVTAQLPVGSTAPSVPSFTVSNPYNVAFSSVPVTVVNGVATVSLYDHGYTVGRMVTVTNCPVTQINGSWRITSVPTGNTFTFTIPSLVGQPTQSSTLTSSYVEPRYDLGYSRDQVITLDFGTSHAGLELDFVLSKFKDVESVQEYLDQSDSRVLCGDYLARGYNLHVLDIGVTSYNGSAYDSLQIQSTVDEYLASLSPGDTLILSDLVHALGLAGITNIRTPISVTYTRYTRDLTPAVAGTITDYLDPSDRTNLFVLGNVTSSVENV